MFLLVLGILGVFLSPYYALYQIKSAYESNDYAKALSYVDLPKVQDNIKATLHARLDETLATNSSLLTLGNLMPKLKDELKSKASDELDKSIQTALTADNLHKTLAGELTDESKKLVAFWAIASDYVDYELLIKDALLGNTTQAVKNQEPIIKERVIKRFGNGVPSDTKMRYCGVNCFEVMGGVSGVPVGAKLYRVGVLNWQIGEVILP